MTTYFTQTLNLLKNISLKIKKIDTIQNPHTFRIDSKIEKWKCNSITFHICKILDRQGTAHCKRIAIFSLKKMHKKPTSNPTPRHNVSNIANIVCACRNCSRIDGDDRYRFIELSHITCHTSIATCTHTRYNSRPLSIQV